jgi:hypothetical protein
MSLPESVINQVGILVDSSLSKLRESRDRIVSRALIRAAIGCLGEGLCSINNEVEASLNQVPVDDSDCDELTHSVDSLFRKAKECLCGQDRDFAVKYLKAAYNLIGNKSEGAGSLTPRPRDYSAVMSRFSEEDLSSPLHARLPTAMEHIPHPNHSHHGHHHPSQ